MSLIKYDNFDETKITFSEPKMYGKNAKQIYLNFDDNLMLFSSPRVRFPFGLSKYEEPGNSIKYSIDISFGDLTLPKHNKFYNIILCIEKQVIEEAKKQSFKWFRKENISDEILDSMFSSSIKHAKNNNYPPNLRLKIPYYNEKFNCSVFNHERERIDDFEAKLERNTKAFCVVKCLGIWIAGGKFGINWQVSQIKLEKPIENKLAGFSFIND